MAAVRPEAAAAAAWWTAQLEGAAEAGLARFEAALAERVEALCADAGWEPDIPTAGSCGRTLAAGPPPDPALARAAAAAGLRAGLAALPAGAVMRIDPGAVEVDLPGEPEPLIIMRIDVES
jgi:hypothetical protein